VTVTVVVRPGCSGSDDGRSAAKTTTSVKRPRNTTATY